jgi:hypothetical protein
MKALITTIMIALATVPGLLVLIVPVSAQFKPMNKPVSKEKEAAEQAMKKKSADDGGQYRSAIERLPDKKFDPWANMR